MRWLLSILALLITLACGRSEKRQQNQDPSAELRARYEEYLSLSKYGWEAHSGDCDSLLFASLSAVAHGKEFDIERARDSNGKWFRVPVEEFPSLGCSSTISRDMLMGVMVYALHFKRLDLIQDLGQYGRDHNWKMGDESKLFDNRTWFTPATISLLYRIEHYLGGKDYIARHGAIATPTEAGYQSHLGMLQLYIVGKVDGELDGEDRADLEQILQHSSQNPLAHALKAAYGDGNQSEATRLLLHYWPAGRLPTTRDWMGDWRTQRDDPSSDLQPSQEEPVRTHSGADFLFAAGIVLGEL